MSIRYTILVANRATGEVHRLTIGRTLAVTVAVGLILLPVVMGVTARQRVHNNVVDLETRSVTLEVENTSYRTASDALREQITSLRTAVDGLGARARLEASTEQAMTRLPESVRRAVGGGTPPASLMSVALLRSPRPAPEQTFGVLRDILDELDASLDLVASDIERRDELAAATPTIWPTRGWLAAGYGNRADPFNGQPEFHSGLDISADAGRPVYATADGVVASAGRSGNYGNLLVIDHGFGIVTRYGHLSKFAVSKGQRVSRGELIGNVGSTGRATGPHVHYEVIVNDRLFNPAQLLLTRPRP